jgi:hypothetical protein
MNRLPALAASAFLLGIALSSNALAATRDEQTKACRADAIKFCSAEIPDKDKITACMKQNVDKLSPECRKMFGKKQ